jgi:predicted dehydrogenase
VATQVRAGWTSGPIGADGRTACVSGAGGQGWARDAHIPAVQALAGLELAAVASKGQTSADAARTAFGVDRAYGDAADLIADPRIDIVTVAYRYRRTVT